MKKLLILITFILVMFGTVSAEPIGFGGGEGSILVEVLTKDDIRFLQIKKMSVKRILAEILIRLDERCKCIHGVSCGIVE